VRGFEVEGEGAVRRVRVPDDLAFLAGHFPGAPIVPGAALIQLALQCAAMPATERVVVQRVRFLRPVVPGAELTLSFTPEGDGVGFAFADGAGDVARGVVAVDR